MTLTLIPRKRRMRRRIETLPTAHDCGRVGIWIRKPAKAGPLVCVVCGKV